MHHLDTYSLVTLLSAVVIFVMGICLMVVSVPRDAELHNYRLSRRFLAAAYMFLAGMQFAGVFFDEQMHLNTIIPCFQAMMFTFALITLINHRFITRKRLGLQLLLMAAITVIVLVNIYVLPKPSRLLFWIINASYFCLFVYYVWIFFREYRNYKRRAENFYSGDEHKRLRWVVEVFIMAAVIGVVAGILEDNNIYFLIFITGYTLLYAYMVIRYINYVYLFHRMAPVVYVPVNENPKTEKFGNLSGFG